MEDLKFATEMEAIQYLADLTGDQIRIAGEEAKETPQHEAKETPEEETKEHIDGGIASGKTPQSIANKHGVSPKLIQKQITKGIKIEMEHTEDPELAREITMDHLMENPTYYDELEAMEKEMKEKAKEKKEKKEEEKDEENS